MFYQKFRRPQIFDDFVWFSYDCMGFSYEFECRDLCDYEFRSYLTTNVEGGKVLDSFARGRGGSLVARNCLMWYWHFALAW